jgi:hypothetical protein
LPILGKTAFVLAFLLAGAPATHAEEPQSARTAYQSYIAALETRLDAQNSSTDGFLWTDQDNLRRDAVRKGQIPVQQIDAPQISGGTIEHWIGGAFLPNATLAQVLKVDQDYAHYATYYAPEIVQARLISHNGNHFQIFYRLKKHKIVTVVLDTIHDIDFVPLSADRYVVRSRSEQVREVRNAGESDEKVLPEGEGLGFLWAMNSYWRVQQRDGGVYIECEVVTLARAIPFGMGALVRSTVQSFASESLANTLRAKQRAVLTSR